MKSLTSHLDLGITSVVEVIERRTVAFMREELGLVADGIDRCMHRGERIVLRATTAIVGVGSRTGVYIAYSYDDSLLRAMTRHYTAELSIVPGEEALYAQETASDVVNVIVGNSTADLAQRGELIALSPPVLLEGARTIQSRPETTMATITLRFPDGKLDVTFVGPRHLFDDNLNFQGEVA